MKFKNVFRFLPKSKVKAQEGKEKGAFSFYTSSPIVTKKTDKSLYVYEQALIIGTSGQPNIHFSDKPFSTSNGCWVAIPKKEANILPKFVYYYLITHKPILQEGFSGVPIQHISKSYIEKIEIPEFSLEKQNQIISILDKISQILEKRQRTIDITKELPISIFLKEFQEYIISSKNAQPINEIISDIQMGKSFKCKKQSRETTAQLAILKQDAVTKRVFDNNQNKVITQEPNHYHRHLIEKGDLLFSRKNTPQLAGSTAYVFENQENLLFPDTMYRLQYNKEKISGIYLYYLFNDPVYREVFTQLLTGTMTSMSNISKGNLNKLKIPCPPLVQQKKFEEKILILYKQKNKLQENLECLTFLLEVISYELFKEDTISIQDWDMELSTILEAIDLENRNFDLFTIRNKKLLELLLKKIEQSVENFPNKVQYDKSVKMVLHFLKEGEIEQKYDAMNKRVVLSVK